jgi:hypothetical protein
MRIRQYAYFAIKSATLPAAAVTAHVGIEPDAVLVRGRRRMNRPPPAHHVWRIECREPGLTVDEQLGRVLERVRPVAARIRELTATGTVSAVMQVVRFLDAVDGEPERVDEIVTDDGEPLRKLAGQHRLLGWGLTAEDLGFLASIPAMLDVDEYS